MKNVTPTTVVSATTTPVEHRKSKKEILEGFYRGRNAVHLTLQRILPDLVASFDIEWDSAERVYEIDDKFGGFRNALNLFNKHIAAKYVEMARNRLADFPLKVGEVQPQIFSEVLEDLKYVEKETFGKIKAAKAEEAWHKANVGVSQLLLDEAKTKAEAEGFLTDEFRTRYEELQDATEAPWVVARWIQNLESEIFTSVIEGRKAKERAAELQEIQKQLDAQRAAKQAAIEAETDQRIAEATIEVMAALYPLRKKKGKKAKSN